MRVLSVFTLFWPHTTPSLLVPRSLCPALHTPFTLTLAQVRDLDYHTGTVKWMLRKNGVRVRWVENISIVEGKERERGRMGMGTGTRICFDQKKGGKGDGQRFV